MQSLQHFHPTYNLKKIEPAKRSQPAQTYSQHFFASLKHSNATQNIYFSNYIEWQGILRERWFYECISEDMLQAEGVFVTKYVEHNFIHEGFPFQTIRCDLNVFNLQRCSFALSFKFYIDNLLVGNGSQKIAFMNHQKRLAKLPNYALKKIRQYELNYEADKL